MQRFKRLAATKYHLQDRIQGFMRASDGAQAIEYAIIGAIGAITIVWAMDAMAPELQGMLAYTTEKLKSFGTLF